MIKRILSFSLSVFIAICVFVATERQAWGYVDPGSGLLALQSAGAVLATVGYFMRRQIRRFFDRNPGKKVDLGTKEGDAAKVA